MESKPDQPKRYASWEEYYMGCRQLALALEQLLDFDRSTLLVGIPRGGIPLTALVYYTLHSHSAILPTLLLCPTPAGAKNRIAAWSSCYEASSQITLCILDDIADTGDTLNLWRDSLSALQNANVLTATLFRRSTAKITPTIVAFPVLTANEWIVFPYE